jgi:hypothetical protein
LPGNDLKSEKIDLPNNTKRLVAFFDSKSYWHMYINKTLEKWIPVINSYGNPEKLDILIFIEIDTVKLSEIDSMLVNGGLQYPVIYDFDNYFRNTIIKSHTLPKYGNTMSFISYIFDEDNNIIQLTNPTIPNFYRDIEKFLKKNH